jgi:site-specific DNA-methyltransferase (adenine-specific)
MQTVKIGLIKPNPNNPRIIKDEAFKKLVKSIRELPEMAAVRPIVVNQDMIVLGGNMRLRAMKEAGWTEAPIVQVDWDEEKQRQFIIKDNVSGGEWDWEMLANEWEASDLLDWGLDLPDNFQEPGEPEPAEDEYELPTQIKTDIREGDYFQIGDHRLLCGSSTDQDQVNRLFEGQLADMIMTDPPYNINYESANGKKIINDAMQDGEFYEFLLKFYKAYEAVTKPGGAWYVWHADTESLNFRAAFKQSGLLLKQCLIWAKSSFTIGRQDYQWKHEPCLYGWREGAAHYFTDDRTKPTVIEDQIDPTKMSKAQLVKIVQEMTGDTMKTTVLRADKPSRNELHPTMKPILLLAPLISNSSKPGQIVGDAFLGSGSTMVAAHQLNRKCYGMELDPAYCQVVLDRMQQLDPEIKIFKNGEPYQRIQ